MRIETIAVRAGHAVDSATGAVTPPIHLSTTFEREADGSYRGGHQYTRTSNPNRELLEKALVALEGGTAALAYMDAALAGRAYFAGDALSIADIALVAYTRWAPEGGFDLAPHRHVRGWIARVEDDLGLQHAL